MVRCAVNRLQVEMSLTLAALQQVWLFDVQSTIGS